MHELSIALSIIDVASEEAERLGGNVVAVHLRLGPLAGVVKEALLSAFERAREQSPLEHASLLIEETPIVIECPRCQREQPALSVQEIACAVCGTPAARVIKGRELEVRALELSDEAVPETPSSRETRP